LNSTEAFGLVQVEAMMSGIPCVASSLPGVRCPVQMHGMGEVVPIGDSQALVQALFKVFARKTQYTCDKNALLDQYAPDRVASEFEDLFNRLRKKHRSNHSD
jgi:glycosyltransferase involved in cell wall biosynthesis